MVSTQGFGEEFRVEDCRVALLLVLDDLQRDGGMLLHSHHTSVEVLGASVPSEGERLVL